MFQNERNEIISAFKKQEFPILVATDVAARGLDIRGVTHVVNFQMPKEVEEYVHRYDKSSFVCIQIS